MKTLKELSQIESYIKNHHLEALFDHHQMGVLQLHQFQQHEFIVEEKTDVKYLYLVLEGESRVSPASINGKSGLLEFIFPMDVIGCLEYFAKDQYYYSVEALSVCTFLAIPVSSIETHFTHNIPFYKYMCENMAKLMKRTSSRYSSSLLYPLKNRLAKYLSDVSSMQNTSSIKINQTQTAEYFGVTSRHLRRILAELEDELILSRQGSHIKITDMDKLNEYVMVYL